MSGKVLLLSVLLVLLVSGGDSSPAVRGATGTNVLQKLLSSKEKLVPAVRVERRVHLSEDEREMVNKQIIQAISDVMNSDCMSGRDYQGWVDFGRRDAE